MKPSIYSKSALYAEQMEHSSSIGSDGLEVQLLEELYNEKGVFRLHKIFDTERLKDYNIKVIHTPIQFLDRTLILDYYMLYPEFQLILADICKFANDCSKNGEPVKVLMHAGPSLEYLNYTGLFPKVLLGIDKLLNQFPNINIVIENSSVLNNDVDGKIECFENAFEAAVIADYLRTLLGTDRVGSVLDVCHANMACKMLDALWGAYKPENKPRYTLEDFFAKFADSCQLLHLASFKGTGVGKGLHGISFTESDKAECFHALDLYHKYNYSRPITLEVAEDDYMNRKGFIQTLSIVNEYYEMR